MISVGATGWTKEWDNPAVAGGNFYRLWWLKNTHGGLPLPAGSGEIAEPTSAASVYVADCSSRELTGQELDVLAPGAWVAGRFRVRMVTVISPGGRRPQWNRDFFYVGGTSMGRPT